MRVTTPPSPAGLGKHGRAPPVNQAAAPPSSSGLCLVIPNSSTIRRSILNGSKSRS
jgi:hypothetical protein